MARERGPGGGGPGTARQAEEPLVLKSRRVDVRIRENLALVRFELVVENPTAQPREGELPFTAPDGAAVFETTLAKNVSSKDRVSRLVTAALASDAYASVGKEVRAADEARRASDPSGATLLAGGVPNVPRTPTPPPIVVGDPALLELIAGSSYRLRFFPVMPRDDQKVSLTIAVEARRDEGAYELRIPLADDARFVRGRAVSESLRVSAEGAVEDLASTSHELRRTAGGLEAPIGSAKELVLRYRPGAKAQPVDVAGEPPVAFAKGEWAQAIRALREVRGLHRGEPAAVTRENSILVIDRTELKRLLKAKGR